MNREWKVTRSFISSISKHNTLISRPACIYSHSDIGRLCMDEIDNTTRMTIKPSFLTIVSDSDDLFSNNRLNINPGSSGDLSSYNDDTSGSITFTSDS